jgi:hypothetical protein
MPNAAAVQTEEKLKGTHFLNKHYLSNLSKKSDFQLIEKYQQKTS